MISLVITQWAESALVIYFTDWSENSNWQPRRILLSSFWYYAHQVSGKMHCENSTLAIFYNIGQTMSEFLQTDFSQQLLDLNSYFVSKVYAEGGKKKNQAREGILFEALCCCELC